MNILTKSMAVAMLASAPILSFSQSAGATAPGSTGHAVTSLNWNGYHKCKALGNSGWTASARGLLGDGGGSWRGGGFRQFQVRTCFETKSACNRFIRRIHHEIPLIEQLYHAGCYSRSG